MVAGRSHDPRLSVQPDRAPLAPLNSTVFTVSVIILTVIYSVTVGAATFVPRQATAPAHVFASPEWLEFIDHEQVAAQVHREKDIVDPVKERLGLPVF